MKCRHGGDNDCLINTTIMIILTVLYVGKLQAESLGTFKAIVALNRCGVPAWFTISSFLHQIEESPNK